MIKELTDPLGKTATFTYDSAGRLTSKRDRNNNTVSYAYTTTDRLYTIACPDSTGVAYTYNQHDRLTIIKIGTAGLLKKHVFMCQVVIPAKDGIHNILILQRLDSR